MRTTEIKTFHSRSIKVMSRWGLILTLAAATSGAAWAQAQDGGTIEIKLGTTVSRTYDDVKAAGYAYGPKQDFDATAKETHIWLPYGTKGVYNEIAGTKAMDPEPQKPAMMINGVDGLTCVKWGYKLHFDKSISAFHMSTSLAELGLTNAVAGVEYSVDGQKWLPIKETDKSAMVNQFVAPTDFKATGLKTQDLYIRFYSRDKTDPAAATGKNVFFKLWTAGDPSWGDATTTFFNIQPQLWVTSAD
jgi:hypothetical protein